MAWDDICNILSSCLSSIPIFLTKKETDAIDMKTGLQFLQTLHTG
jgi:hypothetical protein